MNTRFRITVIILAIIVCIGLIWPNIGTRTIQVHFLPGQTEQQMQETAQGIDNFLKEHYAGRYHGEFTEVEENGKKVKLFLVKGNMVQAAFLNELSRLPGVDAERVEVEKMWVEENIKAKPFKLGLDLQGGMNLLMEADFEKLTQMLETQYPPKYIANLEAKIVAAKDPAEKETMQNELNEIKRLMEITPEKKREYVLGAKEIIRSRIDTFGVSEPLVRMQGEDKIEISLPGVRSPQQAKRLISSTARVEYRLAEPGGSQGKYTMLANKRFQEYLDLKSEAEKKVFIEKVEKEVKLPAEFAIYVNWQRKPKNFSDPEGRFAKMKRIPTNFYVLEREIALSGDDITPNTYPFYDQENLTYAVSFKLTPTGAKKFGKVTSENPGRLLAVIIDEKIVSAPVINQPIFSGSAQISGDFDNDEASDLALIIKEGALPVPLKIVEERSIGPSLGKVSIESGVKAIVYGLIGVAIFMILYYHFAGVIAVAALALNLVFISAILALMKFTITLPGLAGIVLTLGMIVDANVIIYERIREELGKGKSLKVALDQGFERATWTILDSNLTTVLAALVLLQLGTGPIKGFAVTLFIGILTSLFTSLYITRTFLYLLVYDLNFKKFSIGWKTYLRLQKNGAEL